jgi:hypothetical protein
MSHPRNRKRQLPLQKQPGESRQTHNGEITELDEPLTPKPSSSRVSSQWKSRVNSQRKSTNCLLQLCGGFSRVKQLKDELDKRGWLINESKRGVTRRPIWKGGGRGDRLYVTAVREKAFEDQRIWLRVER